MKPTVALVDDDRNILVSLEEILKKEDFLIQSYSDGISALKGMYRMPPDIAVIDIKMPKMDGYELFRKIREKLKIPVIFLTSKDKEVDRLKGLMQGADNYVTKGGNFSKQILVETIKNTLNRIKLETDQPCNLDTRCKYCRYGNWKFFYRISLRHTLFKF